MRSHTYRTSAALLVLCMLLWFSPGQLIASAWNPTFLVNTESFQTVDSGDASTNIEFRFGDNANKRILWNVTGAGSGTFLFTRGTFVQGNITATGSLSVKKSMSGTALRVDGNADVWGHLSATGSLKTKSGAIINADNDSNDAILQFGNTTAPQTLKFMNARQRFLFSKNLSVLGTLSGSSLRLDNLTTSGGVVYSSGSQLRVTARGSSGNLLISQGNVAPVWKAPVGSMVWYLENVKVTTSGSAVVTMPFGMTATSVSLNAKVAPTGTGILVNIRKNGTSIFSTKPGIYKDYRSGGTGAVLSVTDLSQGAVMTMDIDRVGSTLAGSGLTIMLNGTRKY